MKELTCVLCPNGCRLGITWEGTELLSVRNNRCSNGKKYAKSELFDPRRVLTATVKVRGGETPLVSVKSTKPVPKGLIRDMAWRLRQYEMTAPVNSGDLVARNLLLSGADIVATAAVQAKEREGKGGLASKIFPLLTNREK